MPENSIDGIVGKLVALGYKVGIVEEMEKASDVKKAQAASSSARKVVVRSLRKIYTPGTMRDEELLGGGDAKPLVCIVPQHGAAGVGGRADQVETLTDTLLGVCLLDCSTGRFNVGTLALHQLDVLLRTHRPHEVGSARYVCVHAGDSSTGKLCAKSRGGRERHGLPLSGHLARSWSPVSAFARERAASLRRTCASLALRQVVHARGSLIGPLKSWLRNSTSIAVWSTLPPGHRDDEFWCTNPH